VCGLNPCNEAATNALDSVLEIDFVFGEVLLAPPCITTNVATVAVAPLFNAGFCTAQQAGVSTCEAVPTGSIQRLCCCSADSAACPTSDPCA
jgi:hypothetical protein